MAMTLHEQIEKRVHNFNAGPAVLPLPVLQQIQSEMLNYRGSGMCVMEMSHRSKWFEDILAQTEADLRKLLGLPAAYSVIFLQGGAHLQFAMVPMNLRSKDASADYVETGTWSQGAIKEAQKLGRVRVAASSKDSKFDHIPAQSDLQLDPKAAYLHFTSNNTIYGTEWAGEPVPPPRVPLVCDASSDILSRPIDVTKYGLIYGGAQKNIGPSGVTIVIVRTDLLERTPPDLPVMLDYRLMAEKQSLYNTPPTFAIYVAGLVLQRLLGIGGLAEIDRRNAAKASLLYKTIDESGGFYRGHARPDSRSRMNATFRLPDEQLEKEFVKLAESEGMVGLAGHRSVGGIRASMYNALPLESVEALAQFMIEFQRAHG
jgi:phosphoserine aminotransferase